MTRLNHAETIDKDLSRETDDAMIAKARSLRPLLEAHAQQHEDRGELSADVITALESAGFWKMVVPRRWGGLSMSASAVMQVYVELSKGCPSTSWVLGIMNAGIMTICRMSERCQKEVFANGIPRVAGVGMPTGQARAVAGGYIVSGSWNYASGSHHADWLMAAVTEPDGAEGPGALLIAPTSAFTIEPTWNAVGLKGTGSDTMRADAIFVPQHRMMLFREATDRGAPGLHYDESTDHWSTGPLIRAMGIAVLIGMVEGLLEVAIGDNSARPLSLTKFQRKADSSVFQATVGEVAAMILTAKTLMEKATREIDLLATLKRQMDYDSLARHRGLAALAIRMLRDAADKLGDMIGSSGFLMTHAGQRYWRDFSTGVRHASFLSDPGMEVYGRALLGFPIEDNIVSPKYL